MREILLVQRHVLDRHPIPPDVERKRDAHLQATYEYLGLHADGPASYKTTRRCSARPCSPGESAAGSHAHPLTAHRGASCSEAVVFSAGTSSRPSRPRASVRVFDRVPTRDGRAHRRGHRMVRRRLRQPWRCRRSGRRLRCRLPPGGDDAAEDVERGSGSRPRVEPAADGPLPGRRPFEHGVKRVVFASSGGTVYGIPLRCRLRKAIRRSRSARTASTSSPSSSTCICTTRCTGSTTASCDSPTRSASDSGAMRRRGRSPCSSTRRCAARRSPCGETVAPCATTSTSVTWRERSALRRRTRHRPASSTSAPARATASTSCSSRSRACCDARVPRRYSEARPFDVPVNVLDIGLADRVLGWQPRVTFQDGLDRTLRWLQTSR